MDNHRNGSVKASANKLAAQAERTGKLPKEARIRYAGAILFVAVTASAGNVLLKYGLDRLQVPPLHSVPDLFRVAGQALTNFWLILGMILEVVQFVALTYAFRLGPLSLTVPLREASIYILTGLLSLHFLDEQVGLLRWSAIFVILIGFTLIGISGRED